jgi:Ca2+-binding RTX toxin-like protein
MRRLILAIAIALTAAPAASAATIANMDFTGGLTVLSQESDHAEDIRVIGRLSPEGAVAEWDVESSGCISVGFTCVQTTDHVDCSDAGPLSGRATCFRRAAGVTVALKGGDDNLDVFRGKDDTFTIDMGAGNDDVNTDALEINQGEFPASNTNGRWNATLGTGNDTYIGSAGPDFVQGGDGNDSIDPGPAPDGVSAGAGNDVVDAGPETGRDPDAYDGGSGIDTLSYHQRTTGIFAAAIGSTGGASGENDGIAGFERINGGAGNDSILGFSSNGGPGNDVLTGSNGDDTIVGGTGADTLRGFGGDDLINANDGVADTRIDCSTGIDTVFLDLKDPVPNDAENCELIDRRKVDEEPGTEILTSSARLRDGQIGVHLHCPRKARCAGTLNHVRYGIRPRASTTVRVPTRHKGLVVVTSREAGRKGAETVVARVRVR